MQQYFQIFMQIQQQKLNIFSTQMKIENNKNTKKDINYKKILGYVNIAKVSTNVLANQIEA